MNIKINGVECTNPKELSAAIMGLNDQYNPGNAPAMMHHYRQIISKMGQVLVAAEENLATAESNIVNTKAYAQECNEKAEFLRNSNTQFRQGVADLQDELRESKALVQGFKNESGKLRAELQNTKNALDITQARVSRLESDNTDHLYTIDRLLKANSQPSTTVAADRPKLPEHKFVEGASAYFSDGRVVSIKRHEENPHYLVAIQSDATETKFVLTQEALYALTAVANHVVENRI